MGMEQSPSSETEQTEYTWVKALIKAEKEADIETWQQFADEAEDDAMAWALAGLKQWKDAELQEKVIQEFDKNELRYVEAEADLAEANSVEEQFELLRRMTIGQRAGLFELKSRQVQAMMEQGS